MALGCLLMAACSAKASAACPMFRLGSEVTVDASAFFEGHESAYQLCANGTCATPQAVSPRPWVVFLPVDAAGKLDVRVRITSREGAVLLQAVSSVPVRHVDDSACGDEAYTGAVKVARSGVLTTS